MQCPVRVSFNRDLNFIFTIYISYRHIRRSSTCFVNRNNMGTFYRIIV